MLVGTDFSAPATRALELAFELAPTASVHVSHIWRPWPSGEPGSWTQLSGLAALERALERDANALGAALVETQSAAGRHIHFEAICGVSVATQLIAQSAGFDLVALGSRGADSDGRDLFGRTAEAVLRGVQCSVLIASG